MRLAYAAFFVVTSFVGACKAYPASHIAEFEMPVKDYPQLIAELDVLATPFGLKRLAAAAGLDELHGREVLFFAYEAQGKMAQRHVMSVTDIKGPGKVLVRVHENGLTDAVQRAKFITDLIEALRLFGGVLEARAPQE